MGYYDFEVIQTNTGVPLRVIVTHDGRTTTAPFIKTDIDGEYYAEFRRLGIFKKDGSVKIQNLRDYSYYVPNKTIKITTE